MALLIHYASWLAAMALLLVCSAFFSTSEAALFYLRRPDRRLLAAGNPSQRLAAALLVNPDRLLTAVLFWNLLVNVAYLAAASVVGIELERDGRTAVAGTFSVAAVLVIIVLGEMLPKSLAVLRPRIIAALVAVPLAAMVKLLDPLLPVFAAANLLSQRLVWPRFEPEPYLRIHDLERAVRLSVADAALVEQEQRVLESIVLLSEIPVDELMRPRRQMLSFRPPVALADLRGRLPQSGYLLVTEPDTEEIAAALCLDELWEAPETGLDRRRAGDLRPLVRHGGRRASRRCSPAAAARPPWSTNSARQSASSPSTTSSTRSSAAPPAAASAFCGGRRSGRSPRACGTSRA